MPRLKHPPEIAAVYVHARGGLSYGVFAVYALLFAYVGQWMWATVGEPFKNATEQNERIVATNMLLSGAEERNVLQLAYRTRIKLFYRPDGLAASPEQAAEQLHWELERGPGRWTLVARNESPYSVSLRRVGLGNEEHQVTARGSLIPAQSSRRFGIEPLATSQGFFDWINDYGVTQRRRFEL